MLSYSRPVERCRPLLGTFVRVRVHGLAPERARAAIDAAFAEIAAVHRLMSFQDPDSDVARLNRGAYLSPIAVDPRTREVLEHARRLSFQSASAFDVTVAPMLVANGTLPHPDGPRPDPEATWRDVELHADGRVRFQRRLWIDLSGIAKGYAVDRAITTLLEHGPHQACVNAGGDLRVTGMAAETVRLAADGAETVLVAIAEGALAASAAAFPAVHVDPRGGVIGAPFVAVAAPRCIDADALTKVVMILGDAAAPVLARHNAYACVFRDGWRTIGAA